MSEEFRVEGNQLPQRKDDGKRVIDESNYQIFAPRQNGPSAIGRGGDPLFRRIRATREQLDEILEEATTVQDWIQRETSNQVALTCLDNENLKEIYFEIKDGFGEYGPILLMGFKNPQGVEIPRLKLFDHNGDVIQVLTGPLAIEELNKRALAYKSSNNTYETIEVNDIDENVILTENISDYSGDVSDYS